MYTGVTMPYKDKEKKREYQRNWAAARRKKYLEGKFCAVCESTEELEVDHIDRSTKIDHRIWSWSEDRIVEELSKCQILCKTHHLEKTVEESLTTHGRSWYKNGTCRCEICKAANAEYMREWRRNAVER